MNTVLKKWTFTQVSLVLGALTLPTLTASDRGKLPMDFSGESKSVSSKRKRSKSPIQNKSHHPKVGRVNTVTFAKPLPEGSSEPTSPIAADMDQPSAAHISHAEQQVGPFKKQHESYLSYFMGSKPYHITFNYLPVDDITEILKKIASKPLAPHKGVVTVYSQQPSLQFTSEDGIKKAKAILAELKEIDTQCTREKVEEKETEAVDAFIKTDRNKHKQAFDDVLIDPTAEAIKETLEELLKLYNDKIEDYPKDIILTLAQKQKRIFFRDVKILKEHVPDSAQLIMCIKMVIKEITDDVTNTTMKICEKRSLSFSEHLQPTLTLKGKYNNVDGQEVEYDNSKPFRQLAVHLNQVSQELIADASKELTKESKQPQPVQRPSAQAAVAPSHIGQPAQPTVVQPQAPTQAPAKKKKKKKKKKSTCKKVSELFGCLFNQDSDSSDSE